MTETIHMPSLDEIDLSDHDAFWERVPYEWFRTLRSEAPVFFNPEADGPGFYAVTRYADIREVHRHVEIYSSEIGARRWRTSSPTRSRRANR
jgi:cytochrome P450